VIDNNIDGVDVDLEWDAVTLGYSDFVIELNSALKSKGKGMTAAFPGETRFSNITDEALQTFDFINIMAYDYTGPWNPSKPGQHSSYQNAESSVNFWKNIGVSGDKLTLGVPFYGYDFSNSSNVTAFTFGEMVSTNNSYSEIDNVGMKYYNGRQTIKSKVKLASEQVSGIMIWELGQDSFSEYSLLKTIQKEYGILGFKTTSLCGN
jgi:GH18 family chitinase